MEKPMKTRLRPLGLSMAALLLGAAGPAKAETSPYYIGVSQALSYNTNPARLPDATAEGSWWSTTSLLGGFDERYGRQHFYGNANVAANVYSSLSQLNSTTYGASAGWDWETINRLSGTMYASYNQSLPNYGGLNQASLLEVQRVIQNSGLAYATAQYGVLSLMQAELRVAYSSVHYDADDLASQLRFSRYELNQTSVRLRLRKQFSGQLTAGTGVAYTKGDYFAIGSEFGRYDVFVTTDWQATGQSSFSGRVGYSWWDYTGVNPYQQNGVTGWLAWNYVPTGKLSFVTRVSYDTQANSVFTSVGGGTPGGVGENQWLTTGLQFTARYAFSGKTSFNASLEYFSQSRDGTDIPLGGGPVVFDDSRNRTVNLLVGATWLPARNWQVDCNLTLNDRNQRASSNQSITLTPYTAYGGSCSAQFLFQ
jgi:hypothetical protein